MPDRLTDSEIVKAWEICGKSTNGCSHSKYTCEDCYLNGQPMCSSLLLQDTIDYFNRLQAENERLEKEVFTYKIRWAKAEVRETKAKAEAYKEFAENSIERVEKVKLKYQRLCKEQGEEMEEHMHIHFNGIIEIINNLLKELVGE